MLFQTPDYIAVLHEMFHDVRIIPLDAHSHLSPGIRQLRGDSRGHWDGDTLVVETTNFDDQMLARQFEPPPGPNRRLVERFTRVDAGTLRYEYTMDDPETFTGPWTAVLPMKRTDEAIYEYACHEGNRSMVNILTGARVQEKAAASDESPQ